MEVHMDLVGVMDLKQIGQVKARVYSPRFTMNLCLGYLKLCEIDDSLKQALTE